MLTVEPTRKKNHRGGKVLSLSILFAVFGLVGLLVIVTLTGEVQAPTTKKLDTPVVEQVAPTVPLPPPSADEATNELQPLAPKVEPIAPDPEKQADTDWVRIWDLMASLGNSFGERNAEGVVTPDNAVKWIMDFLNGLNYTSTGYGHPITSRTTGEPISPTTIECYLMGYVPDKPYLKPNCPTY